ncbi:MAG: tRNA-intron lyase [Archaeoglobaceae archaeon]
MSVKGVVGPMNGKIEHDTVAVPYSSRLDRRGFGRKKEDTLFLHPVEAVYLCLKGDLHIEKEGETLGTPEIFSWAEELNPDFPSYYFAYEDLRDRGNKIKLEGKFLKGRKTYLPISERRKITIPEIFQLQSKVQNLVLAVVDEESEVTYYQAHEWDIEGNQKDDIEKINGHLISDRVITDNRFIFDRLFYGNEKNELISLSLIESLYLAEKGKMDVYRSGENVDYSEIRKQGGLVEENFNKRYHVYKDLKERRLSVKTGFKFGSDFRVYDQIKSVKDLPHSKYLVSVIDDVEMPLYVIARAIRLAQNVRKRMVFAFYSNEESSQEEIKYLAIKWVKV